MAEVQIDDAGTHSDALRAQSDGFCDLPQGHRHAVTYAMWVE